MSLLSISSDAKTIKGEKHGYLTGIMYLAPAMVSGRELCPNRSPGCTESCLFTAGRGRMPQVMNARINRTKRFHGDRQAFMLSLAYEIEGLCDQARQRGMTPLVRLNGTSDIPWENVRGGAPGSSIMEWFPEVQFYDYTKSAQRMHKFITTDVYWPLNYHLTFSRSERNEPECARILAEGGNVAVVFADAYLPRSWAGAPVIDGDRSDVRIREGRGLVIGLRAKGRARKDTTGFVVRKKVA